MNSQLIVSALLIGSVVVAAFILFVLPRWHERRLLAAPFPSGWEQILQRRFPLYRQLSASEQERLRGMIQLFLADRDFHGCAGLALTDEIRVSIAAQACLLMLYRGMPLYPGLRHILVYPAAFRVRRGQARHPDGTVSEDDQILQGQAWQQGKVILSWDDVEYGLNDPQDGRNVTLHEFAHQLDQQNGAMDGMPIVPHELQAEWQRVVSRTLADRRRAADEWRQDVLDVYATENEAELFAVATEVFFERPQALAADHPALFRLLCAYYAVDPRSWHR